MLVKLRSNKSEHEVSKEVWDLMSKDQQRNYQVVRKSDLKESPKPVENIKKLDKPETGEVNKK